MKPSDKVFDQLPEPKQFEVSVEFGDAIEAAVKAHGEGVVSWAWRSFFVQFLPFAGALLAEQTLFNQMKAHGLTGEQAEEAIRLYGCLTTAANPHHAWLAAEIILRATPKDAMDNLNAALMPVQTVAN